MKFLSCKPVAWGRFRDQSVLNQVGDRESLDQRTLPAGEEIGWQKQPRTTKVGAWCYFDGSEGKMEGKRDTENGIEGRYKEVCLRTVRFWETGMRNWGGREM